MKINDLPKPQPLAVPEWKLKLQEFWLKSSDTQRLDMKYMLKMNDREGVRSLLESWQPLEEKKKKKKKKAKRKKSFSYGSFGGWFYPGYHNNSGADSSSDGADAGGDGGGESLRENQNLNSILSEFANECCQQLAIASVPQIRLRRDPEWCKRNRTFGMFDHAKNEINLSVANRHPVDVMRTLAHELVHHRQNEMQKLPGNAGETGSDFENEANAAAGIIMRKFAEQHPNLFTDVVNESSGYIPTEKEKNDPRFSTALTVDIKPGETGRQANKLGLATDAQGRPALLMKKLNNQLQQIKESVDVDQDLLEVDMSPGALEKWAQSPDAQDIKVGIEYEFIFPDTESAENDDEPVDYDYDMDEPAYDLDQIIEFFQGGDMPISDSEARDLRNEVDEEFWEWATLSFSDDFGLEEFVEWMWNNAWGDEEDDLEAEAQEQLGDDADESKVNNMARDMFRDLIADEWENQSDYYQQARDAEFDDWLSTVDFRDFLESQGIRTMMDVSTVWNTEFPYMTSSGLGGIEEWDRWAKQLEQVVEMPVRISDTYHGGARRSGEWVMEPDSSLDPDEPFDAGIELISPPIPLPQALATMKRIQKWAKENKVYTNDSTGLHMNISIPKSAVDYVKLIMFMGDKHVLDEFGRAANYYASSAFDKIAKRVATNRPDSQLGEQEAISNASVNIDTAMEMMRNNLIELAGKYVQNSVGSEKYTSAHVKKAGDNTYIEFRSPGGDWLTRSPEEMAGTVLRFARAMTIAGDPAAERKEYGKKLYKLLAGWKETKIRGSDPRTQFPGYEKTMDSLFAKYTSGIITRDELKKEWADRVLQRAGDTANNQPQPQPQSAPAATAQPAKKLKPQPSKKATDLAKRIKAQGPGMRVITNPMKRPHLTPEDNNWAIMDRNTGKIVVTFSDERSGFQSAEIRATDYLERNGMNPNQHLLQALGD